MPQLFWDISQFSLHFYYSVLFFYLGYCLMFHLFFNLCLSGFHVLWTNSHAPMPTNSFFADEKLNFASKKYLFTSSNQFFAGEILLFASDFFSRQKKKEKKKKNRSAWAKKKSFSHLMSHTMHFKRFFSNSISYHFLQCRMLIIH